jgi:nucleotide-binding universal stress UspA family protein
VTTHIEAGFVTDKLIQLAAATACHRIVLGNRSHSGVRTMLLGSTAYQVMHLSTLPVTLVK